MAIQNRRGPDASYDPNKMLAGEFAVATDEGKLYIAFGPGNSKRILTEDDAETINSTLESKAPKASPAFTGAPTAPTAAAGTSTTQLATTAFVANAISGIAGAGYGVCQTTADTTTKTVTIRGLTVKKGTVVAVMFTEEAYGAFSLNVNGTTSTVYYNEVGYLPQGLITAGSTALFMYDDGYVFLAVNKVGKSQITATDLGSGTVEIGLV